MDQDLRPGDVFLTRGTALISRLIRFFTRGLGEKRTRVNHVGVVVQGGPVDVAVVVEALRTVRRHPLARYADGRTQVAVYRPSNLTDQEITSIVDAAESYVGRGYGYVKILAHGLDWILQGAYVFRRLTRNDHYPICSWLVAHAYAKAGKNFGVEPGAASPDDIWDFVEENPGTYVEVRPS